MMVNKEKEVQAMYKNCLIEGYDVNYDDCKLLYELTEEKGISDEEAIRIIYDRKRN